MRSPGALLITTLIHALILGSSISQEQYQAPSCPDGILSLRQYRRGSVPRKPHLVRFEVVIQNNCTAAPCAIAGIHVKCNNFRSATYVDPDVFLNLGSGDCLVSDGGSIRWRDSVRFYYTSAVMNPLSVASCMVS